MDLELKKQRDVSFMLEHELSDDQLEKLIENKFIRAKQYHEALQKRSTKVELAE